jgi:hypothetical protein
MVIDSKPGAYYVSVVRGTDYRVLLGPFMNDHAGALAKVDDVRKKAQDLDPKAAWYAFGTCRLDVESGELAPKGILNSYFEKEIAA